MRGPKPPVVIVSAEERRALEGLVRAHRTPQQVAVRARIVLAAADGLNNTEIARRLEVDADTVRLWRMRWLGLQAVTLGDLSITERLTDAPKPGSPARITPEQVCQVVALACEAPETAGRPISQWSAREIADEIMKRGIIDRISPRHAARLLKRGISNPTSFATG
jgi:putative transposase